MAKMRSEIRKGGKKERFLKIPPPFPLRVGKSQEAAGVEKVGRYTSQEPTMQHGNIKPV